MSKLQKTVASILLAEALLLALLERLIITGTEVAFRQQPARNGGCQSVVLEERGPAFRCDPVLADPLIVCSHARDPELEDPATHARFLIHRNRTRIDVCAFKLVSFGVICYVAIDNKYTRYLPSSV